MEDLRFLARPIYFLFRNILVASAPATPTAVSETSRSIKVTWNEPSPLNGILHSYQIKLKKSGASFSSPIPVDKNTREKIVDSLDPYSSYELQVKLHICYIMVQMKMI